MKHSKQVTNDIRFRLGIKITLWWMNKTFDQPVKNNLITYDSIQKIAAGQRNDYTTGCLLDYNYFKGYYKMIAIDFSKQQALDADPKAI